MTNGTKSIFLFISVVIGIALAISGVQLYYLFMPIDHWFHYSEVTPVADIHTGEFPSFLSTVEVFRKTNVEYNDILFCKLEGDEKFTFYSEYKSSSYGKLIDGIEHNEWRYGHPVNRPGECFLKSNIILQLPFGCKKVQTVIGTKFKVLK